MTLPPIRRSVVVDATPERAYAAWTDEIAQWWPLATHSVFKRDNSVGFVDGDLIETAADGRRTVWGTVLEADPPRLLRLSWHPGNEDERGTVEVRFVPLGQRRTLVTLTHTGWEHYPLPDSARADYRAGWVGVLRHYREGTAAEPASRDGGEVWLILEPRAGGRGARSGGVHPSAVRRAPRLRRLAGRGRRPGGCRTPARRRGGRADDHPRTRVVRGGLRRSRRTGRFGSGRPVRPPRSALAGRFGRLTRGCQRTRCDSVHRTR